MEGKIATNQKRAGPSVAVPDTLGTTKACHTPERSVSPVNEAQEHVKDFRIM